MDKPEQQTKEPAKRPRVRLASPRKQLERTIQKMTKLSETPMKPEKLVDLMTTLAGLQVRLLDMDRDTKVDALMKEIERLTSELAARPTDNSSEVAELNRREWESIKARSKERKEFDVELESLKSDIVTLQAKNAELVTTNGELKSANSELTVKVQSLQQEKVELEGAITKVEPRTAAELLADVEAKLADARAKLKEKNPPC